jgi:hypothetical protein
VTAGWSVTVSGVDFGYADATTTGGLGLSSCPTAAWVSSSSVACYVARGEGPLWEALATVASIVGTQTSVFSYDGPFCLCRVRPPGALLCLCSMPRAH